MNVRRLIDILKDYPSDMEVSIGTEYGSKNIYAVNSSFRGKDTEGRVFEFDEVDMRESLVDASYTGSLMKEEDYEEFITLNIFL